MEKVDKNFVPAPAFTGAKRGMVYTRGPQGLGYYTDAYAEDEEQPLKKQVSVDAAMV